MCMKNILAIGIVALASLCFCVNAQDKGGAGNTPKQAAKAAAKKARAGKSAKAVAKALAEMEVLHAEPDMNAKYFIYLQSASWCGPCRQEMPKIVAAYPEMKKKGVEIILVGADNTPEAMVKYLESFHAEFGGVHGRDPKVRDLPGFEPAAGIPAANFVDSRGNLIFTGHGSNVLKWESIFGIGKKKKK